MYAFHLEYALHKLYCLTQQKAASDVVVVKQQKTIIVSLSQWKKPHNERLTQKLAAIQGLPESNIVPNIRCTVSPSASRELFVWKKPPPPSSMFLCVPKAFSLLLGRTLCSFVVTAFSGWLNDSFPYPRKS